MSYYERKTEETLKCIPPKIWESMPSVVKAAWEKEAYYFTGTPKEFALKFLLHIRNTHSEYKNEILDLMEVI